MISNRALEGIEREIHNIMESISGIGTSKHDARAISQAVGANGHKISQDIHSTKYYQDIKNDFRNLAIFARTNLNQKIQDINKITVTKWIRSKNLTVRSASNMISHISKIEHFLKTTRSELNELRKELKESFRVNHKKSRAYNTHKINVSRMQSNMQPAAKLQIEYGLRMSEATGITVRTNTLHKTDFFTKEDKGLYPEQNILIFAGKGGIIQKKELSKELTENIVNNAPHGRYQVNNRTYERHLQKEVIKSGQKWNGTHGFRHSYAQNSLAKGLPKTEVSKQMGHSREDIVNTYLR